MKKHLLPIIIILVAFGGSIVMCSHEITLQNIHNINQDNFNKVYIFPDDKMIYIDEKGSVILYDFNDNKEIKIISNIGKEVSNIHGLGEVALICDYENKIIWIIYSDGMINSIEFQHYQRNDLIEIFDNITPLADGKIVYCLNKEIYIIENNKIIAKYRYDFIISQVMNKFLEKDDLIIGSDIFSIFAISKISGELKWKKNINPKISYKDYADIIHQPILKENYLLFNTVLDIYCMDVTNGKILWRKKRKYGSNIFGGDIGYIFDDYYITYAPKLAALQIKDGKKIWETDRYIVDVDTLYNNFLIYSDSVEGSVYFIDCLTGKIVYILRDDRLKDSLSRFVSTKEHLYLISSEKIYIVKGI